jgi:hypothetical protein
MRSKSITRGREPRSEKQQDDEVSEPLINDVLRFAQTDLPAAEDRRGWKQASELLLRLHRWTWLRPGGAWPTDRSPAAPREVQRPFIENAHRELRRGLDRLFRGSARRQWDLPEFPARRGMQRLGKGRVVLVQTAEWPDTVWLAVAELLQRFGNRVRECPLKECRVLFLRNRKQQACSPRHRARFYMRNRRRKEKEEKDAFLKEHRS